MYEALRGWDPRAAAAEIDRAATELKLNGVIINSHTGGEYPDEETYWPLLEAAEAARVGQVPDLPSSAPTAPVTPFPKK